MKSVLISIRPKWVEKICHEIGKNTNGKPIYEKPIEVRKGRPSEVPFRGFIYATKPKKWHKCGAVCVSDESLWLANGKVEMCDGLKFWADGVEDYQCLNGKVIGEFICDKIVRYDCQVIACAKYEVNGAYIEEELRYNAGSCLTAEEMFSYSKGKTLYGWHISGLKIYDKPKELSDFWKLEKCPYTSENGCTYNYHCFRAGQMNRCGETLTRPPQSWCYCE